MKVLLISANQLPAFPTGPAAVAVAVRRTGHEVQIFETLFASDLKTDLGELRERMRPDVVGISIRLVFGDLLDETAPWARATLTCPRAYARSWLWCGVLRMP